MKTISIEKENTIKAYIRSCKEVWQAEVNKLATIDLLKEERSNLLTAIKAMK